MGMKGEELFPSKKRKKERVLVKNEKMGWWKDVSADDQQIKTQNLFAIMRQR